ncbi:phosphatase PAP2 family protein [Novosphingobium rosa]|uniref:phosphatase PAP2 family protein n=1 Tax=Novosphingobium rosa TaxID=76978 RepID=UPI000833DDB1|nr:phosphatase PAP2 family protein [Novosphingobium rosa]
MIDARRFVLIATALCVAGTSALLTATHLSLDASHMSMSLPLLAVTPFLPLAVYRSEGIVWLDRVVCGFACFGLFILITFTGCIASYGMAALSHGWVDEHLLAADRIIGLNWLDYWNFVQHHPLLNAMLLKAYTSIITSPALIIAALALTGRFDRLYRFLAADLLSLLVTDISLAFAPATSAAASFLPHDLPNFPMAGLAHVAIIEGLRSGTQTTIDLSALTGLIAVPSFHAAACTLYAWATWPLGKLRYPFLAVNMAMLLSTPIHGGHYFSDVIAGVLVALLAIAVSQRFSVSEMSPRRREAAPDATAVGAPAFT